MNKKSKLLFCLFTAAGLTLVCYILFHELGHMIVMLSAGAVIDDFSIIGAHVSSHGGNYTDISDLWLHVNGAFLPLITAYFYLIFYRNDLKSTFYRILSFFIGLIPVCSLLAWVFIPVAFMNGTAPAGDDATKFLLNSSKTGSPIIVSVTAALLIGIGVLLMIKKGAVKNYIEEIRDLNEK